MGFCRFNYGGFTKKTHLNEDLRSSEGANQIEISGGTKARAKLLREEYAWQVGKLQNR